MKMDRGYASATVNLVRNAMVVITDDKFPEFTDLGFPLFGA